MKTYDRDLIRGYIHRTFPVQWVNWMSTVEDSRAREELGKVLFNGDELMDLTDPMVRENVIDCVLRHQSLTAMVDKECSAAINKMVAEMKNKQTNQS